MRSLELNQTLSHVGKCPDLQMHV